MFGNYKNRRDDDDESFVCVFVLGGYDGVFWLIKINLGEGINHTPPS
jgi:hypothetical protein